MNVRKEHDYKYHCKHYYPAEISILQSVIRFYMGFIIGWFIGMYLI